MQDLYEKIHLILKELRIIVPHAVKQDLIHHCIVNVLETTILNDNDFYQIVSRCSYNFIYDYKKTKRLLNIDELSIAYENNILPNNLHKTNSPNYNKLETHISIKDLILNKGEYTLSEIANLLKITRTHLYRAINTNNLGYKSFLRLKNLRSYNKKTSTKKLVKLLISNSLNYKNLPIARSSYYYGIKHGFTYSQIYKICQYLKENLNIKEDIL